MSKMTKAVLAMHSKDSRADRTQPTDRIRSIKAAIRREPYSICLERPTLLRAFKKTRAARSNAHALIRRSQSLAYLFSNRQPRIYDDELIIGNMSSKRIAANYFPEGTSFNILEDIFRLDRRAVPLELSARERRKLVFLALSGFRDSVAYKALFRPSRLFAMRDMLFAKRYIVTEEAGVGHLVGNYKYIVEHGLRESDRVAAECVTHRSTPDGQALNSDQLAFYESMRIAIRGIRRMAERLAEEAERIATIASTSKERRAQLLASARACRHVPYHPARTFQEGLQACWLIHVSLCLEDFEQGVSFGRLDQALYLLYRREIDEGTLDDIRATELIASFELKCCETIPLYSNRMDKYFSGNAVAQGITVGGVDKDGNDATNDLSGLFLDAYGQIGTREPSLHARVHAQTPGWFIEKAVEVLQRTGARPAFMGDAAIIGALEHAGFSTEHARDYGVIGCVELASQGRTYNSADAALVNLPLCLELALNEGKTFSGDSLGAKTRPRSQMNDIDDVVAAYREQVVHSVAGVAQVLGWLEQAYRKHRTTPINSLVTEGCLASGYDVTWGGAEYDFTSIQASGLADVGDSLYALQRLVFEEQRYRLEDLVRILGQDFKGHETLSLELRTRVPHYGNGDERVDRMTQLAADAFSDAVTAHRNSRGGKWLAGYYSMTCGTAFGRHTGALANGRRAGERLSNGASPIDGADREGPTALFRSVSSLDTTNWGNCHVLNVKFDKRTIGGASGSAALSSLLRNYLVDRGGMQVQVNVLDSAALLEARDNPDAFPNLLVRVSGYCAYFNDLQPEVQDEIIARAAHGVR